MAAANMSNVHVLVCQKGTHPNEGLKDGSLTLIDMQTEVQIVFNYLREGV